MDEQTFKDTVERLKKANAVVLGLDESIRGDAFKILRPYVEGKSTTVRDVLHQDGGEDGGQQEAPDTSNAEAFVRSQNLARPADAATAIAAWWFGEYGSAPLRRADVERIGNEIGVTLPNRPDKTLAGMRHDSRPVYRTAGRGKFVPTVPHGELFIQETYGVTKGRKTPPADADE